MKCVWVQDRLLLYHAKELGSKEALLVVRHLERCDDCVALLEEIVESRDTLRDIVRTAVQPSPSLDARIMDRIQTLPLRRYPWAVQMQIWNKSSILALASSAVLLLTAGYYWGRSNRIVSPRIPVENASTRPMLDLAALSTAHLAWNSHTIVDPIDSREIYANLSKKTGLHVIPLDLIQQNLKLKQGEVVQMNRVPVAELHYVWKGIPVTLAQADGMRLAPPTTLREMKDHGRCFLIQHINDLTVVLWCEGTDNYILAARVPPAELFSLACIMSDKLKKG